MDGTTSTEPVSTPRAWWYQPEAVLLVVLVSGIYFTRITALPIAGEEGRWARGAVQMLETGDWIVLRQQGKVFPERPPMSSWAMALVGTVRGKVDAVAVRLPSALAILLTSLVVFVYARSFLSPFGAFASGAAYATLGQVLEIGRMGESESLFTFFLSSALLLWHLGYHRGWRPTAVWALGYGLAALAALVKGPQAPVYFAGVSGVFLLVQRDWRWLFGWSHAAGIGIFALIVGLWQVPYYLATDWSSVVATWAGLASDRLTLSGLAYHVATYPLETFACLLPWSPLLIMFAKPGFRQGLRDQAPMLTYLAIALCVTYPTLWLASGARGRYFMPLYPCIALLVGVVVQRCVQTRHRTGADWHPFALCCAFGFAGLGVFVVIAGVSEGPFWQAVRQPWPFAAPFAAAVSLGAALLFWCCRSTGSAQTKTAFVTICTLVGLTWTGFVLNVQQSSWHDLQPSVSKLKNRLPEPGKLVSFSPVDHRFAYAYETQIEQLPWPRTPADVPADVDYFCFTRTRGDTPQSRAAGRGRSWWQTPGTLPFGWEQVGTVCCDRRKRSEPDSVVVVGKIVRPSASVASRPRQLD